MHVNEKLTTPLTTSGFSSDLGSLVQDYYRLKNQSLIFALIFFSVSGIFLNLPGKIE